MNISNRSKISLAQLLDLFDYEVINTLLEKHSMNDSCSSMEDIRDALNSGEVLDMLEEVLRTKQSLRHKITPRYTFDERWDDFEKCLLLDGYRISEEKTIISIEPIIEGFLVLEDDLAMELNKSSLSQKDAIVTLLKGSANAFKKATPDYNDCLSKAKNSIRDYCSLQG